MRYGKNNVEDYILYSLLNFQASLLEEAKQVLEQELTNTENKVLELEAAVAAEQERLKKEVWFVDFMWR